MIQQVKYFKLIRMSINMDTMKYCPPNITFNDIWIDHGVSKCFMDTISISIISLYLIIFGSIQLWIYHKYGTETDESTLPRSKLYNLQKFVLYFVPILSIIRIILQATILDDGMVYGYMVRIVVHNISFLFYMNLDFLLHIEYSNYLFFYFHLL